MSRSKGGKNKTWSKDEKLRIVRRYFDESISQRNLAKEERIAYGLIANWVSRYLDQGENGLENKKKPGNQFAALHTSNSLSELDRLRLTVAKQEIEIERLKKGYIVKGVGANKEFVTTKDANTKLSTD